MSRIQRRAYAEMFGPTVGDRVRLGDTGLVIEIEYDAQERGNEFLAGFGKTARDGLAQRPRWYGRPGRGGCRDPSLTGRCAGRSAHESADRAAP